MYLYFLAQYIQGGVEDENYGSAFGHEIKGHYGADGMMVKDIDEYLNNSKLKLPVGVIQCMEAGLVAIKLDESRRSNSIIDSR